MPPKKRLPKGAIEVTRHLTIIVNESKWRQWRESQGASMSGVVPEADLGNYMAEALQAHFASLGFDQP